MQCAEGLGYPKDAWGYRGCSQCPSTLTHIPLWEFLGLEFSHRVCLFLKPSKCHFVSISIQTLWTLGFLGSCSKLPSPKGPSKSQLSSVIVWEPGCSVSNAKAGACSLWRCRRRTCSFLCPGFCCSVNTAWLSSIGWHRAWMSASVILDVHTVGLDTILLWVPCLHMRFVSPRCPFLFFYIRPPVTVDEGLTAKIRMLFISVCILITSAKTCSQIRPCSQAPGSEDFKARFGGKTI